MCRQTVLYGAFRLLAFPSSCDVPLAFFVLLLFSAFVLFAGTLPFISMLALGERERKTECQRCGKDWNASTQKMYKMEGKSKRRFLAVTALSVSLTESASLLRFPDLAVPICLSLPFFPCRSLLLFLSAFCPLCPLNQRVGSSQCLVERPRSLHDLRAPFLFFLSHFHVHVSCLVCTERALPHAKSKASERTWCVRLRKNRPWPGFVSFSS